MHFIRTTVLSAVAIFLVAGDASAAIGPIARCERAKLRVAGRGAMAMSRCYGKSAGSGRAVDPTCPQRARDRVAIKFTAAELLNPCPRSGEGPDVVASLDGLASALGSSLAPAAGVSSTCAKLKVFASGRRLRRVLVGQGKHAAQPERERLGILLERANDAYLTDWAKAEALGDCVTVGDATAIAAQVDEAAEGIVDDVRGTLAALAGGRLVGTAVRFDALAQTPYRETAARHFNHVSTWGETVWANVEPDQGVFNLAPLDDVVNFAEANGMPVKGITLVWHEFLPAWMNDLTDPGDFRNAMEHHITTLVGGYAGRIAIWDVVNEAVTGGDYRNTPFLQRLGPDYIADAFHMAHQADPSALLFYNDFAIETVNPSSDFVYQMIVDFLAQGVPIHGIGFQMHVGVTTFWSSASASALQQNLQRFADLGLLVQLAEAEASLGWAVGNRREELLKQRDTYHGMVTVCMAVPGCHMNFFGFTDRYYWPIFFNRDPLMFDRDYRPKPAFFGVRDALLGY